MNKKISDPLFATASAVADTDLLIIGNPNSGQLFKIPTAAFPVLPKTKKLISDTADTTFKSLLGLNTASKEVEQATTTDFNTWSSTGGGNNKLFNNFPYSATYPVVKVKVRSLALQTIKIAILAADNVTVTELQTADLVAGLNTVTLVAPIQLQAGEKIGIIGGGQNFYYISTGDIGSRIYQTTSSAWSPSGLTWSYSIILSYPPDGQPAYNTIKKLSDRAGDVDIAIAAVSAKSDSATAAAGAAALKADAAKNATDGLLGVNTATSVDVEQSTTTDYAAWTLNGGGTNKIFNNFAYSTVFPATKIKVRSVGAQTIKIAKLAADGSTITELQSADLVAGLNTVILSNPVTLAANERIGVIGGGGAGFYYTNTADLGCKIYTTSSGVVTASAYTWSYSVIFTQSYSEAQPKYNTIKKLSTQVEVLYGVSASTKEVEQSTTTDFSAWATYGGTGNKVFNNFAYLTTYPITKVRVKSNAAQSIKIAKLAVDGTTVTELETFSGLAGMNTFSLTNPVTLAAGERLGIISTTSSIAYAATGDIGSRIYTNASSIWGPSNLTFGYSIIYLCPPDNLPKFDNIKKLSDQLETFIVPADRPNGGIEKFQVTVNCNYPNYSNTATTASDSTNYHTDNAAIALPITYVPKGEPTRLVLYCHGAGSKVDATTNNLNSTRAVYLLAKGYAVLDVNGLPADIWEDGEEANKCAGMGGQIALQCYEKAYRYALAKYNLAKDGVMLLGTSMGGITSGNLLAQTGIPVLAHCLEAPITHLYEQAWLRPWFSGAKGTRYQVAKYYNFDNYKTFDFTTTDTTTLTNYWTANKSRLNGYDPANFQAFTLNGVKIKFHKAPLLIIHSVNDNTSQIINSQNFVNSIKNGGGLAELRSIDDGNVYSNQHAPMSFTDDVTDSEGIICKATVREMYLWFKRFDKA